MVFDVGIQIPERNLAQHQPNPPQVEPSSKMKLKHLQSYLEVMIRKVWRLVCFIHFHSLFLSY